MYLAIKTHVDLLKTAYEDLTGGSVAESALPFFKNRRRSQSKGYCTLCLINSDPRLEMASKEMEPTVATYMGWPDCWL